MAYSLPIFEKFQVNGDSTTSLGPRWTKYVKKLENLFVAMNIDSNKRKKALLLHLRVTKCSKFIKLYRT